MDYNENFGEEFNALSYMIQNIKGVDPYDRGKLFQKGTKTGLIKFKENKNLTKSLIESKINEFYSERGFQVNYSVGAYWVKKNNEKYLINVDIKNNEITFAPQN